MATIAFIGLGNMGGPMARNLVKAGHTLRGFDMVAKNVEAAGASVCKSAAEAVKGAEVVVTMLPAGPHVRAVYDEILPVAAKGTLLADCSTIDVDTARAVAKKAEGYGLDMVDAPEIRALLTMHGILRADPWTGPDAVQLDVRSVSPAR